MESPVSSQEESAEGDFFSPENSIQRLLQHASQEIGISKLYWEFILKIGSDGCKIQVTSHTKDEAIKAMNYLCNKLPLLPALRNTFRLPASPELLNNRVVIIELPLELMNLFIKEGNKPLSLLATIEIIKETNNTI